MSLFLLFAGLRTLVQVALQKHSEFVMRGGCAEVKASVQVLPAQAQSTVYHSRDTMERWDKIEFLIFLTLVCS